MNENLDKIIRVVNLLYESISFNKGERPDLVQFKKLFIDEARLIRTTRDSHEIMTVENFINSFNTRIDAGEFLEFRELELKWKIDSFGGIAHAFSTYETDFETSGGRTNGRGINSIQLIEMNGEWKVINILWYNEDDENKIPGKYLP